MRMSIAVRLGLCSATALALSILAGCGTNKAADGSAGLAAAASSGSPSASSLPSTTTTSTPPTTGTTSTPGGPTTKSPAPISYPSTSQAYAQAAANAWAAHDNTRLAAYTTASGYEQFMDIEHPSGPWHFHACSADGDNAACTFDNSNGDRITIDVIPADMHQPHGVPSIVLDKTQFDNDAASMVGEFISAWENGNTYRMIEYSSSSVTSKINKLHQPSSTMVQSVDLTSKAGHSLVTVLAVDSATIVFDVDQNKLGKAHAISLVSAIAG